MKDTPDNDRLKGVRRHERHFYTTNRAFGRFGMRIFEPQTMDKPHWHGHVEANFCIHHKMGYDIDNEAVVVPPGRLAVFWAGIPHRLHTVTTFGNEPPRLANIYLPLDAFLTMNHIMPMQVALLGGGMICFLNRSGLSLCQLSKEWRFLTIRSTLFLQMLICL